MMVRPLRGVTSKQSKELLDKLDEQAKEMVGMQMLFSLAQYLKDWLDEQNTDNLAKQKEAARAKDELEIEKEKEVRDSLSLLAYSVLKLSKYFFYHSTWLILISVFMKEQKVNFNLNTNFRC